MTNIITRNQRLESQHTNDLQYIRSASKLTLLVPEVLKGWDLVWVGANKVTCAQKGVWLGPGKRTTVLTMYQINNNPLKSFKSASSVPSPNSQLYINRHQLASEH